MTTAVLRQALEAAQRLCDEALPKFNWGASALDANAIKLLNEVPGILRAALDAPVVAQSEPYGWLVDGVHFYLVQQFQRNTCTPVPNQIPLYIRLKETS